MEEIWKDIVIQKNGVVYDYTGLYQVSNLGRVRSLGNDKTRKERILKQSYDSNGYLYVRLSKECKAKNFTIHRLVATMFIPNPNGLPVVNHISEVKSENTVGNLEWCTYKYNAQYSAKPHSEETKQKMSENHADFSGGSNPRAKKVVCLETKQVFNCIKDASEWCHGDIKQYFAGRSKSAGGYHWMYLEDYKKDLRKESDIKNTLIAV